MPWSLWITTPSASWQFSIDITSAFTTRSAVWAESIDHLAHARRRLIVFFHHCADTEDAELTRLARTIDR